MKPQSWASSSCNGINRWLRTLFMLSAFWPSFAMAASAQDVINIHQAEFIISDAKTIPAADAGWQAVALPHRSPKATGRDLVGYWYRATFTPATTSRPLWLYLPKLRSGGAIFLNARQVGEIRGADQVDQVRWFRPHLLYLPPHLLREGPNEISVRFAIREPLTSFGEFSVGSEKPLRALYDRLMFWEYTSTGIASVACLLIGAFIVVFWLRQRQETLYGVFGICVLFWGLRTLIFRMPEVPMEHWLLWRFFYYLTTSGFIACITIFLLKFSEFNKPALNRFLVAYWLIGSFAILVIGPAARPFLDSFWTFGFLPFTLYSLMRVIRFAVRQRTPSGIAMVLATLLALGFALHDYAVQHGMFRLAEFYLLHLAIPAYLLVMTGVLLDRFINSLKQAESLNEQLALRIAEREKELAASYGRLRALEREHAATEERQRIMRDMHDGVGSQLLSTLVMAQRGAMTQNDMVTLLQECLDDMRLVIDSLSPNHPDLLPVLGNFRFRMESRFRGTGLTLHWRNHDMPATFEIAPHAGLQVLRILQEALTNVLKHAQAKTIEVDLIFSPKSLCIQLMDDGIGITETVNHNGRGLMNMQMRAQKIGAAFNVERLSTGTRVRLDIHLGAVTLPVPDKFPAAAPG